METVHRVMSALLSIVGTLKLLSQKRYSYCYRPCENAFLFENTFSWMKSLGFNSLKMNPPRNNRNSTWLVSVLFQSVPFHTGHQRGGSSVSWLARGVGSQSDGGCTQQFGKAACPFGAGFGSGHGGPSAGSLDPASHRPRTVFGHPPALRPGSLRRRGVQGKLTVVFRLIRWHWHWHPKMFARSATLLGLCHLHSIH